MAQTTNKANKNDDNAGSETDLAGLEHHVDEIMDPKLPDPTPETVKLKPGAPDLPAIDIFAGQDQEKGKEEDSDLGGDLQPSGDTAAVKDTADTQENEKSIEPLAAGAQEPLATASTDEKLPEDKTVDDPAVDPLVDDIVSKEGDNLLEAQDAEIAQAFDNHPLTLRERIRGFFSRWWQNKWARYLTLLALVALLLTIGVVPGSRYFVLNTAGVRAASSLSVHDRTTDLPLKNVTVTVGDQTGQTDQDGVVRLKGLRLGTQQLTIQQLGFAKVNRAVTLGLGSNPLGEVEMTAVGAQYKFKLTDYVSGKPIRDAEAISGEANARSDEKGEIVLTVGELDSARIEINISANGYRTEKLSINTATTAVTTLNMASKRKEVFVSKQSGKFDVYKVDIDGKNKQLLLAATGNERAQMSLVPHPTSEKVALVSSRDTKRNQEGYLLDTLTLIDTTDGSTLTLEHSERVQVVGWVKDRLVYIKVKAGTSAGNAEREQLMSYDPESTARLQLASANYFTDVVLAKGSLYYANTNYSTPGQAQFAKINADNTGKQTLLSASVWNILRNSYDELNLAAGADWYAYKLGDTTAKKNAGPPANQNETRYYLDAPDGKRSLWTDVRDGKGVLLVYDAATKKDKTLATQSGLTFPLRWLDSRTAVYRVVTPAETASYVVSLDGGAPKKIVDMTNVTSMSGQGRWY
jgi:hypothetical protein